MKVAAVAAGAALLRIALAVRLPLADDEAYYWLWSRHLAWGYPDHPPMIAALVALGTAVAGDSPFAIRAVTVLLASATPLLVYALGRDLFDPAAGLRAAVIAVILPVAALGTALAFPDAPLAFFWLFGLWTGWRALRDGGGWWIAAGVALALAVLSKLTAVFLILGLAGAFGSGPWRRALRDPGLYAGAALAAALVAPLIAWNAAHDWSTIRTALAGPPWIQPRSIPENLLLFAVGQILYHGPAALALLAAIIAATRRAGPEWRYLVWMSAPLFLVVLLSAVGARAKPHWPSPAYLSAAVALGALWPG
ncbi:MAG: glycosyltransferase family 39 protein, partial [Armatimonadetes bacterium]|nr:glycosyltransferase family 39 protein [Armatimonadota bacterium]